MKNPWLKKNPFMSMWMSGANALAGKARAAGTAESKRQQTNAVTQATRYWREAWLTAVKPKRPR
jgi:hypothetical protein